MSARGANRGISPDPILQDPTNSQGHNRYSYCLNNPLKYVDPSGYAWGDVVGDRPGHPLGDQQAISPVITLESLFNGGLGLIGPGSMNHWSDAYRDNYSLYFLMNTTKFDNMIANQLSNPYHFSQVAIPYALQNGVTYSGENVQNLCSAIVDPEMYLYRITTPYGEGFVSSLGKIGEMTIHENGAPMFENRTAGLHMPDCEIATGGRDYKFFDADIRIIPESMPYNSYFAGAINTQASTYNSYKKLGLNSSSGKLLMHEFGHYLQNKHGGSLWYNMAVVPTSTYNINTMDMTTYRSSWTEIQANTMSYYYFNYPSFWSFDKYPVNFNYISDELKNKLYYHKP